VVTPTGRKAPALRLIVGPPVTERLMLGERSMPPADRLRVGLVRLIEGEPFPPGVMLRVFGSEPPLPGVRVMLGPLRPVGDGVNRLVASDCPGWRLMLGPRSIVEADGERLMDGVPVVPVRGESGRVTPPEGLRVIDGEPGVAERFTDGVEGPPLVEPLRDESMLRGRSDGLYGVRDIDGVRSGELNRESPGLEGRLICPSGRPIEGEFVDRLGASRKLSMPPRSMDRVGVDWLGRFTVAGRSTVRGAELNDGSLPLDEGDGVENDGVLL
jgi:hypothetical protein